MVSSQVQTINNDTESLDYKTKFDQLNAIEGSFLNLRKRNKNLPYINTYKQRHKSINYQEARNRVKQDRAASQMMEYTPGHSWQETPPVLTAQGSKRPRGNGNYNSGYANHRNTKYFSIHGNSQFDSTKEMLSNFSFQKSSKPLNIMDNFQQTGKRETFGAKTTSIAGIDKSSIAMFENSPGGNK